MKKIIRMIPETIIVSDDLHFLRVADIPPLELTPNDALSALPPNIVKRTYAVETIRERKRFSIKNHYYTIEDDFLNSFFKSEGDKLVQCEKQRRELSGLIAKASFRQRLKYLFRKTLE